MPRTREREREGTRSNTRDKEGKKGGRQGERHIERPHDDYDAIWRGAVRRDAVAVSISCTRPRRESCEKKGGCDVERVAERGEIAMRGESREFSQNLANSSTSVRIVLVNFLQLADF